MRIDLQIEPNDYYQFLKATLLRKGFLVSAELVPLLMEAFKVTSENARKILQRAVAKRIVKSSSPITFGKGQFVYFLYEEKLDKENFKEISGKYRPPLFRILDALDNNGGIISFYEAMKVSASPEEKTSSKVNTLDELIEILVKANLCYLHCDDKSVKYIIYEDRVPEDKLTEARRLVEKELMNQHYSKMVLDSMFIPDILRWLKTINLIDNIKTVYRSKSTPSKGAVHNGLVWDAFAYTKTTGINSTVGAKADTLEKQTLVVLDVLINREYLQSDVDGFLNRIQININSVKSGVRKVMPVVVYKEMSDRCLNTLSRLGFLCFNLGSIFGTRIYEVIERLNVLQLKQFVVTEERIEDTIAKILSTIRTTGQEDKLNDIKGVLFEFLLYPFLKAFYTDAEITQGRVLKLKEKDSKEGYEYDYIIRSAHPKEIVIVELKGYSSSAFIPLGDSNTKNTLRWFFRRTLPFAQKFFKNEISEGYKLKGCFITSAGFFDNGITFLQEINSGDLKPKKLECYYNGESLSTLLEENNFGKIKSTIEKFYNKEPKVEGECTVE